MTTAGDERRLFGWRFTAPLLLASALNPINSSMLATGLTDIAREFTLAPGAAVTLVSVLYLCSATAQPAVGKLGTVLGPRRVFLGGLVVVMIGGLVGALAGSFPWLLASRALIGIGTSAAFPTSMALVRARADRAGLAAPTRVIGLLSIAAQVALVAGLPLGGLLTSALGWRSLLAMNLPLALIALVAVARGVERDPAIGRHTVREMLTALDATGVVLFTAATTGLLVFLGDLTHPRWWLLAVIVAVLTLLIAWERRAPDPLLDVRLLASEPALARTYLRQLLVGLAVSTALYGLSQWREDAAGLDAAAIGVILLPLSVVSILLARIVSVRGWVRGSLVGGALAVIAAGGMLSLLRSGMPGLVPLLLGVAIVYGAANGLTSVATQTALYLQAPADRIGTAAGLLRSFGHIGAIFSASVISVTFGAQPSDAGLRLQGWVVAGLGVVLFLLALDRGIPRTAPRRQRGD
ncbi:MFS transporter [Microbacterium betulae]|uniref:MFS transporter n=1 Tax=Microbacterium betulae TaxID=2981139 RepID=A0AA97I539_9MICO|nr:MFS transporter [Microbacterium sp. AB]WOF21657.1 MFS transporter [Microbacterium sp. AB]